MSSDGVGQARVDELRASSACARRPLWAHVGRVERGKGSHLVVVPVHHLVREGTEGGREGGRKGRREKGSEGVSEGGNREYVSVWE